MSTPIHIVTQITIPATAVKTLNSIPVQLIAGIAEQLINIYAVNIRYNYVSPAFNPATDDFLVIYTGTGSAGGSLLAYPGASFSAKGFVDQTQNMTGYFDNWFWGPNTAFAGPNAAPASDIVGAGLYLTQFHSADQSYTQFPVGTNWSLGGGNLVVTVEYSYLLA